MIHVIALAQRALSQARGHCISPGWKLERERLSQEVALLRDELRTKDMRWSRIPPARGPQYAAWERMAILELRAAQGWSIAETARTFLITADTITSWVRRIETEGSEAFITTTTAVGRILKEKPCPSGKLV
jgi:Helix-turn-helix domain